MPDPSAGAAPAQPDDAPALPSAPRNLWQERAGILAVAAEINRLGLIWRETSMADVGIDGQIEMVNAGGAATGQLMAVQVKSGASYFDDCGEEWRFYPHRKHRFYWERFPLPVLLFLHSPADGAIYWADVRQALRNPRAKDAASVRIPKRNVLRNATASELFAYTGASEEANLPLDAVLTEMAVRTARPDRLPVSYLELFALGLTNGARAIYYGMDLVMEIAESLREGDELTLGPEEHEFLFGFVLFLVEQRLAEVDISDCMTDWYDRQMQPRFLAPLTSRGRALLGLIKTREDQLVAAGRLERPAGIQVAQEAVLHVQLRPSDRERIFLAEDFRRQLALEAGAAGEIPRAS